MEQKIRIEMHPDYSTPSYDNLKFLGREILQARIEPAEGASNLNCYFNARNAAKKRGGTIIDAWEIAEVAGLFLHFRPHVLLKMREGEVIDPTPSEFGLTVTTFFESPTPHELPMPPSYLHPLTNNIEFTIKLRIQNIAYRLIAQKLTPGIKLAIDKHILISDCISKLKAEDIYTEDNLQLLVALFTRGR